jgi:hypothetical protein
MNLRPGIRIHFQTSADEGFRAKQTPGCFGVSMQSRDSNCVGMGSSNSLIRQPLSTERITLDSPPIRGILAQPKATRPEQYGPDFPLFPSFEPFTVRAAPDISSTRPKIAYKSGSAAVFEVPQATTPANTTALLSLRQH